jgi:sugar lactone lactonase YvrE
MVSCGSYTWAANGQTYTTSGEYLHQNVVSNTYCAATSSVDGCASGDEYISNVTIGAINKTSLCGNSDNYNDYTSNSTAVLAGSSYAISVTNPHSFSGDSISVWADWNKDGDFTDSGEEYSLSYSSNFYGGNGPGYGTGSIAVPAGASNGNVRMRIRVVWSETPLACGNTEYGEIEDYTLVVSGGVSNGGVSNSTCPTYDKLVLTINAVTSSSNSIAICSSALPYSWNGLTFNAAGTQTKTGLTNAAGCDSSASLTITLKATSTSSNSIVLLANQLPYTWNGLTFNAAGTQTKTGLTNAAGCDSSASLTIALPPNISYTTPLTYTVGSLISPLIPTNTGGNTVGVLNNVGTLAGSGSVGSTDGTGNNSSFNGPQQLAVDSSGNIYVADQFNNKIRKITPAGVVSTLATGTSFASPAGVAIDNIGNLYVSDTYNNRIVKIATSGVVSTLAGSGSEGNSDGYGTAASFKWPNQLTLDNYNNIYVADAGNNSIRKITPAGLVSTFASIPDAPEALVVDNAGNVYVVNNGHNVYKITSGGVVSIFAGSSAPGSTDATGTAASFESPYGINIDINGNLYIGDFGNNKIRKITPNGVVTTFAGGSTSSSVDGSLITAGFSGPTGIAFDAQGKMYVADYIGNKIRVISGAAYTITPALPAGLSMDANTGIISGTPTVITTATNYKIIAINGAGSDSFNINIKVNAACTPTISSNNVTINSNQLPYSWNGLTFNAAGTQTAHLTNAAGCDSAATLTLNVNAVSATLNVTAFLQGLYLGGGIMAAAPFSADGVSSATVADTIMIELHDTTSSHNLIATSKSTVSTTGNVSCNFSGTLMGNAYYVVIKHRNSIATWSTNPVVLTQSNNYDFSNAANKAYGSNMANDGNGVFLIFTGDINQDGSVDFSDYPDLDISSNNGDLGYYVTDLNGDASVDFSDYPLLDINSNLGTLSITP